MAAVNLLATKGLTRTFGGLVAVDRVDFAVPRGQVRALIGPNGAGKTTLVGMLCGRIAATSGAITFDGRDITELPAHRRIAMGMAYTFQVTSIFARLSLRENVALAVRRCGRLDERQVERKVAEALSRVRLTEPADQMAGDLSYGHQRLLEIAMGIAQEPQLLILDEPTQGLADSEIEGFNALIRSMAGATTIVLIEHNMDVVMETADYITVLNFGEILAEGKPQAIRADAAVQAAYLGSA